MLGLRTLVLAFTCACKASMYVTVLPRSQRFCLSGRCLVYARWFWLSLAPARLQCTSPCCPGPSDSVSVADAWSTHVGFGFHLRLQGFNVRHRVAQVPAIPLDESQERRREDVLPEGSKERPLVQPRRFEVLL